MRKSIPLFLLLGTIAVLLLYRPSIAYAEAQNLSALSNVVSQQMDMKKQLVIIAEDITELANCRESREDSEIDQTVPCSPGSVIRVQTITLSEAEKAGIDYILLQDNEIVNSELMDFLAFSVRQEISPEMKPESSCNAGIRSTSVYVSMIGSGIDENVTINSNYDVRATCYVADIVDRTKRDGRNTWAGISWLYTQNISGQYSRNINVLTQWSSYYPVGYAAVGQDATYKFIPTGIGGTVTYAYLRYNE